MNLQIGDVVQRKIHNHGNVKCGDIRTVTAINCGATGRNIRLSDDRFNYSHDPSNLKLIKHKDIPYEEIPDGAIFTMRYIGNKYNKLIGKKVGVAIDGLCSGPTVNGYGEYTPYNTYGVLGDAEFSLAIPEERMLLESHMGVQSAPPSVPIPPVKNNIHYSMY